jgi:hypothetical protein
LRAALTHNDRSPARNGQNVVDGHDEVAVDVAGGKVDVVVQCREQAIDASRAEFARVS